MESKVEDDFNQWEVGNYFSMEKVLGYGSYGTVVSAFNHKKNKSVAIKKISDVYHSTEETKQILRGIILLHKIKHPYIVKLYDVIQAYKGSKNLFLEMEYFPFDMFSLFEANLNLTSAQIKKIMYSLLSALAYLHSAGIIHRDIKPGNILISNDYDIRLCDFDLAKPIYNILGQRPVFMPESNEMKEFHEQIRLASYSNNSIENKEEMLFDEIDDECEPDMPFQRSNEPSSAEIFGKSSKLAQSTSMLKDINREKSLEMELNAKAIVFDSKSKLSKYLYESKADRAKLQRKLSHHVVTRWYRPPEIIFAEHEYDYSVDIWSMGCIFAELLKMKAETGLQPSERRPIFMGSYCFPFSPAPSEDLNAYGPDKVKDEDQISKILSLNGTPTFDEVSFMTSDNAINYINSFPHQSKKSLTEFVPNITNEENNLLSQMLEFNPFFRITAESCLKHSYFSDVTGCLPYCPSDTKIDLGADFENDLTMDKITELLWQEVNSFKMENNK